MSRKFMKIKKIVIPILSLAIMMGSMVGCSVVKSDELLKMLETDSTISIELAMPDYEVVQKGEEKYFDWTELDQLGTYDRGFRQSVDEVFNINIVTESGRNGKNGVLFIGEEGKRNGNAVLADAFRNKVFMEKYWGDAKVKEALAKAASEAYIDLGEGETEKILAAFNAYYNLFIDGSEGSSYFFNAQESLTREGFMSGLYRAEHGVAEIESDELFGEKVGGVTGHTKFAKELEEFSFLGTDNKSLDAVTYQGNISRAEAVYMLVKMHFNEEYESVEGKAKAFTDTKNGGDLALKLGFKVKDKESKEITEKGRWESYTLAYMMKNPDKGLQEELYKAMVVAKDKGIITSSESRWDEPLSKSEAILMIINTQNALNKSIGYAFDKEYGEMVVAEVPVDEEEPSTVVENGDWLVAVDPDDKPTDGNGMTYKELRYEVEDYYKAMTRNGGFTHEDAMDKAEAYAKVMGTTLKELNSLPGYSVSIGEKAPVAVKPEPQTPSTPTQPLQPSNPSAPTTPKPTAPEPTQPSAPSKNTITIDGVAYPVSKHGYAMTPWDTDGNGRNDDLEPYYSDVDDTDSWEPGRENPFEMP